MRVTNFRMTAEDDRRLMAAVEFLGLTQIQVLRDALAFYMGEADDRIKRQREDVVRRNRKHQPIAPQPDDTVTLQEVVS